MRVPDLDVDEEVPDPDVLAYRLVARESPLDRAVLHELIGRPKRYVELKPLLGGKNDHNLTVALKRLQDWGLIERRTDARQEPVVHSYELTPLGIQVVLAIPAIQPIHESVERFEKARMGVELADLQEIMRAPPRPEPVVYAGARAGRLDLSNIVQKSDPRRFLQEGAGFLVGEAEIGASAQTRPEPKLEDFSQKKEPRGKPRR